MGGDVIPLMYPTFFAVYPESEQLSGVIEAQRELCGSTGVRISMRPPELLHVSVAEGGRSLQRRTSLRRAIAEAGGYFSCHAFEIRFDKIAAFGKNGTAYAAIADDDSQARVHALRLAVADACQRVGLHASRGRHVAHMTLGYGDLHLAMPVLIQPFSFCAVKVDLVASDRGRSQHASMARWNLL